MPICISCRYPVRSLYTSYSKADDRALGKGVRLTQCPRCKRFADKYVEHDFVVLFIDLVLIKPQVGGPGRARASRADEGGLAQVYRHLLFNRLGRDDGHFDVGAAASACAAAGTRGCMLMGGSAPSSASASCSSSSTST